jgi:glycosyltransferase involved in cell wall biosynthesis
VRGLELKGARAAADAESVENFDRRLEEAEALFGDGRADEARAAFDALARDTAGDPPRLSRVLNDLGVVSAALGDADGAEAHLAAAVQADPANADALENFAAICRDRGDHGQAAHWLRHALAVEPERDGIRAALIEALETAHDFDEADALRRGTAGRKPRVLVLAHVFHPSVGGTEALAEQAALALRERGWEVEVGTEPHPDRIPGGHRSIPVHELPDDGGASLARLLDERPFDALLAFASPLGWPIVHPPALPEPRPRLVLVPCINQDGYRQVVSNPRIRAQYAGLLRQADVVVHSSHHGWDMRLARELGLRTTYVPNAATCLTPARPPAQRNGARLLCVGNLWEEKNHVGLLETLAGVPGDFTLRIIGGPPPPTQPNPLPRLEQLAAADGRVQLTGRAPADEVAAAMAESDLLLLPSRVEATPLVLVEAMAHGLPWIATTGCGSARDHAGGLVVPLAQFSDAIRFLLADDAVHAALGVAGRAHYEAAYSWDVVGDRFHALLSGAAEVPGAALPPEAAESTERARAAYYDALLAARAGAIAAVAA